MSRSFYLAHWPPVLISLLPLLLQPLRNPHTLSSTCISTIQAQAVPHAQSPGEFLRLCLLSKDWPGCVIVAPHSGPGHHQTVGPIFPSVRGALRLPRPPPVSFSLSVSLLTTLFAGKTLGAAAACSLPENHLPWGCWAGRRYFFLGVCF